MTALQIIFFLAFGALCGSVAMSIVVMNKMADLRRKSNLLDYIERNKISVLAPDRITNSWEASYLSKFSYAGTSIEEAVENLSHVIDR